MLIYQNIIQKKEKNLLKVFPFLLILVSEIDKIFKTNTIPILKTGKNGTCILTRKQVALIFFLSFLGLIDDNNRDNMNNFDV